MTAEQTPMTAAREAWLAQHRHAFWDCQACHRPADDPWTIAHDAFDAGWTAAMARQTGDRCYCPCTDCRGLLQDRAARAAGKNWDYEDDPYE